jgi:Ig-like domain from next to BRCA1 gene
MYNSPLAHEILNVYNLDNTCKKFTAQYSTDDGGKHMNKTQKIILILTMLTLVALACNAPGNSALSDADKQATSVAETVAAQMADNNQSPPDDPATATITVEATQPAAPTATTQPTNTPQPTTTSIPCNRASFVSDITYPDGSDVKVNEGFVKTWRLKNDGSCTWTSGYKIIFSHGDRMNAPDEVVLTGGTVAPGQTVDVSVSLTAPSNQGTYKGYFKLKASDGQVFGIGAAGNTAFWVEVEVFPDTPDVIVLKPSASVSYREQLKCVTGGGTNYMLVFRIENNGILDINSTSVYIKDHSTNEEFTRTSNLFGSVSGCISIATDTLTSGHSAFIYSEYYKFQMIGNSVTAVIKVCSENNLGGECIEKTLNFVE